MNLIDKITKNVATGILFSIALNNSIAQNRSINFEKSQSFEYAKNKTKDSNKLIFMDCYTSWCGPCKSMDKNVFTNDSAAEFYNQNFINLKMDMESDSGKILKKEYNVDAYPTFLYLNGEGKLLHKKIGASESHDFIELGKQALNSETRLEALIKKYEKGKRDTGFIYNYIKTLNHAGIEYEEILEDYFKTQKEENLISKTAWNIIFIKKDWTSTESKPFNFLMENQEKFDLIYSLDFVDNKILEAYSSEFSRLLYNKDFNSEYYKKWENRIKKQNFHRLDEVLLDGELQYSKKIGNWDKFAKNTVLLINKQKREYSANKLNLFAWRFYKHIKDKSLLKRAVVLAEHLVEKDNKGENNDTYARLLYVTGNTAKAIEVEKRAIKLAKENKDEALTEDFRKILQEMEAGE